MAFDEMNMEAKHPASKKHTKLVSKKGGYDM